MINASAVPEIVATLQSPAGGQYSLLPKLIINNNQQTLPVALVRWHSYDVNPLDLFVLFVELYLCVIWLVGQ